MLVTCATVLMAPNTGLTGKKDDFVKDGYGSCRERPLGPW